MHMTIRGRPDRDRRQETLYRDGDICYRLDPTWANLPPGLTYTPIIAGVCDADDSAYLLTRDPHRPILVLAPDGKYVRSIGAGRFTFPHGIAITPGGTLLCADADQHQIIEITTDGAEIRRLGSGQPSDSGYDAGRWRARQRVGDGIPMDKPFQPDWAFYESLASIVRAAPPFNRPTGVAVTANGDIFVADGYGNAAVHRFAANGDLIATWGGPGNQPGRFIVPHHLAVDALGRVWVAEREGNRVQVFSTNGEVVAIIAGSLYQPTGIWTDGTHAYIAERGGLTIVSIQIEVVAQFGYAFSGLTPHGIFGNARGDLFLCMLSPDRPYNVLRLSPMP